MNLFFLIASLLVFWIGFSRAKQMRASGQSLNALPRYYGYNLVLCSFVPVFLLILAWLSLESSVVNAILANNLPSDFSESTNLFINQVRLSSGSSVDNLEGTLKTSVVLYQKVMMISKILLVVLSISLFVLGFLYAWKALKTTANSRKSVEKFIYSVLFTSSLIAILTTVGIVFSVLLESVNFFGEIPFADFMFGLNWNPQMSSQGADASGSFGAIPLFVGTLIISCIALFVAVPIGLMTAIYLAEYASSKVRAIVKPILELLAGVPTVVYGFFAALTVAPFIRNFGESLGLSVASESALAAGLVMGVMIVPFVSSLSDDVITAVPDPLRNGSLALGATKSETIKKVVIPAALPGIVSGVLLATSRAIGETMIVVMAAGLAANLTANPLEAVTTVTVQIVKLLTGDQEFNSAKTLAAFALALMLFFTTLILNVVALRIVKKYREQYE